jgi:hypothetical protein
VLVVRPGLTVVTVGDVVTGGFVDIVGVVVVLMVVFERQTMAPLTHFVPGDTAPRLTYAELTQTDQVVPSDEHWIDPWVQPEVPVVVAALELLVVGVVEGEVDVDRVVLVPVVAVLLVDKFDEPPDPLPVPTTVTSTLFPAAQSVVAATFVIPA